VELEELPPPVWQHFAVLGCIVEKNIFMEQLKLREGEKLYHTRFGNL
jgi:hypothetical protein